MEMVARFGFAGFFAVVALVAPAFAGPGLPAPVVAECASPRLPASILDGPVAQPASPLPTIPVKANGVTLHLAVAADDRERELGLMCVTKLKPQHGMIFVFDRSQRWDFWMKNTLVPLDMVWLDAAGTITKIWPDVPAATRSTPDDQVARRAGEGLYVVELPDGEAAKDGLTTGERLTFELLHTSQ